MRFPGWGMPLKVERVDTCAIMTAERRFRRSTNRPFAALSTLHRNMSAIAETEELPFIPVNVPRLGGNEKKYLAECIETSWISAFGPFVKRFEEAMCKYTGRNFATTCTNGSVAIDIAIAALDLKEGDEVIMPTFTIISCACEMYRRGIKIVTVDCDETFNMDVKQVEAAITDKTKAIMCVHIYHFACDMDAILALAKKHDLKVIEDSAELIGECFAGGRLGEREGRRAGCCC